MVEEVARGIYRIGVVLPNNPLKELNSYYIRGEGSSLLIDTGFRCPECQEALEAGLAELGADRAHMDVLATHVHSDHSGMADLFVGKDRCIYMSGIDLAHERQVLNGEIYSQLRERYIKEGFAAGEVDYIQTHNPARMMSLPEVTDAFQGVEDGQVLTVGEYRLQAILVPGHTPGDLMLWAEEQGIMFTGDHVLFDITPNITSWTGMRDALGSYLENLERVREYPVRLALPGHRHTGDYRARVEAIQRHHAARLADALRIVEAAPGLTAYEIAGRMSWNIRARSWDEFPLVQKWFAVGECISHLDHLRRRHLVRSEFTAEKWRYWPGEAQDAKA